MSVDQKLAVVMAAMFFLGFVVGYTWGKRNG